MEFLTSEEENFCKFMTCSNDKSEGYRQSFPDSKNLSKFEITSKANALMKKRHILARITSMRDSAARVAMLSGAQVLEEWAKIAFADVNELEQYQRVNCCHCHGEHGKYQWINDEEFAQALAICIDAKKPLPSDEGGYGFRFNGKINNSCLNCLGEGIERIFINDSRTLSESGKRLYGGLKQTQSGIEIVKRNQDAALLNLAKYFKLLNNENDKKDDSDSIEITIKGGLP